MITTILLANLAINLCFLLVGIRQGRKDCQSNIKHRLETGIMPYDVREILHDVFFSIGGKRKINRKVGLFR